MFFGGTYINDNNPNKDEILNSSSDMNDYFNEKESNTFDNIDDVEHKEDISKTLGDFDNNETQESLGN